MLSLVIITEAKKVDDYWSKKFSFSLCANELGLPITQGGW